MTARHRSGGESEGSGEISRRTGLWIAALAAVSFVVALALMAYGPDLEEEETAGPSVFSSSALGHKALIEFLEASGIDARIRRSRRVFHGGPSAPVILIEPLSAETPGTLESYLSMILRRASEHSAAVVIVLPKWTGEAMEAHSGLWVERVSLRHEESVQEVIDWAASAGTDRARVQRPRGFVRAALQCETEWGERLEAGIIAPQLLQSQRLEPVVWTDDGVLIGRSRIADSDSPVYFVSDPDILNNHGLPRQDNAVLVLRFIAEILGARSVVLDEVVHGLGREQPFMSELLRFPLVLTALHGALLFAAAAWAGIGRFGKTLPAPSRILPGKLSLIESTARLLSYRGRVADSAARYFEEAIAEVARRLYLPRELKREGVLEALQGFTEKRGVKVDLARTSARLGALRATGKLASEEAVAIARRIHQWRREMLDAD